jgi:hypothetical protein
MELEGRELVVAGVTDDARFNIEGPGPAHTKDTEDPRRDRETMSCAIDVAQRPGTD